MRERALVLDTCALLWLAGNNPLLSDTARDHIRRASIVYVSAISAWEIGLKVTRGTLELPLEPQEWFTRVIAHHTLSVAPLDIDILMAANRLPWHHHDPADRFIIATAMRENAAIITADTAISSYEVRVIR